MSRGGNWCKNFLLFSSVVFIVLGRSCMLNAILIIILTRIFTETRGGECHGLTQLGF